MNQLSICIIGGKGKMGAAFAKLFQSCDWKTLVVDVDTRLTGEEAIPQADIVMFSVPITSTVEVIRKLAPLAKSDALICDITSIKIPAVEAMATDAPSTCEVMGLHPMCGPGGIEDLQEQVLAVCEVRVGKKTKALLDLFERKGAIIKRTTAEQHDTMMAVVQGLTHFSAIASGMALRKLGVDLKEAMAFSSPVYRLRIAMIGRVLSQSSQLYAEIQTENPQTLLAINAYQEASEELAQAVSSKDSMAFQKAFEEAADFMRGYLDEAKTETDKIIHFLSHE